MNAIRSSKSLESRINARESEMVGGGWEAAGAANPQWGEAARLERKALLWGTGTTQAK